MAKEITFNEEMRKRLYKGVKTAVDSISSTLGPSGRCVLIDNGYGTPTATKDGVTVAKAITLEDPVENVGAQLIKSISSATDNDAGDGTTSASVIALGILTEGLKATSSGVNPIKLRNGINEAVSDVVERLKGITEEVTTEEQIAQVASISANNDKELGKLIADAVSTAGSAGVVTTAESKTGKTYMEFTEGMSFDNGYLSPYFSTDKTNLVVEYENPYLLLTDKPITSLEPIVGLLESVSREGRPLVIIGESVEGDALTALIVNSLRGIIKVCAVKAPSFGDNRKAMLEDIAVLTGGEVITESVGLKLENATVMQLGECSSIRITKDKTTIIGGSGDKEELEERVNSIKKDIEDASDYTKEKLQERVAKLAGGVAVIKVGDVSETALKEKKYRIEDALNATRSAIEEGIIPGGGTALCQISKELKDEGVIKGDADFMRGYNIVLDAIISPTRTIAENCGLSGEVVVDKVQNSEKGIGFNALTGEFENMVESGIIDPVKVTRLALQNASSVASLVLTSSCTITNKPEKEQLNPNLAGMSPSPMM